jgi:hypothetical protein
VIDVATGRELRTLEDHESSVFRGAFSMDGHTLSTATAEWFVYLWDLTTGKRLRKFSVWEEPERMPPGLTSKSSWSYGFALAPDGRLLAIGQQGGKVLLVETTTGKIIRRLTWSDRGVPALAFSADGRTLAGGGWVGPSILLWEVAMGRERHRLARHQGRIFSLTFSGDGKTLVSGGEDTTALVWDLTGRLDGREPPRDRLSAGELDACWTDLAAADAAVGYRAIRHLAAAPAQAVPYLGKLLSPVQPMDQGRLERLIADLGSDQFAAREKATKELEAAGELAEPLLQKALEAKPDLEMRRRVERLLEKLKRDEWEPSLDRLRTLRALEVLERIGTSEAKQVLRGLAQGAPEARLTRDAQAALQRLARRPAPEP